MVCGFRVLALPFFKSGRKGEKKRITTCSGVSSSSSSSQEGRKEERRTSSLPPAIWIYIAAFSYWDLVKFLYFAIPTRFTLPYLQTHVLTLIDSQEDRQVTPKKQQQKFRTSLSLSLSLSQVSEVSKNWTSAELNLQQYLSQSIIPLPQ